MKGRIFRNQAYSLKSRNNSSKKSLYVFFETNVVKNIKSKQFYLYKIRYFGFGAAMTQLSFYLSLLNPHLSLELTVFPC